MPRSMRVMAGEWTSTFRSSLTGLVLTEPTKAGAQETSARPQSPITADQINEQLWRAALQAWHEAPEIRHSVKAARNSLGESNRAKWRLQSRVTRWDERGRTKHWASLTTRPPRRIEEKICSQVSGVSSKTPLRPAPQLFALETFGLPELDGASRDCALARCRLAVEVVVQLTPAEEIPAEVNERAHQRGAESV